MTGVISFPFLYRSPHSPIYFLLSVQSTQVLLIIPSQVKQHYTFRDTIIPSFIIGKQYHAFTANFGKKFNSTCTL